MTPPPPALAPFVRLASVQVRSRPWRLTTCIGCDYLLIHVLRGREWLEVAGQRHQLDRGACYLVPPDTPLDKGSDHGSDSVAVRFDLVADRHRDRRPGNMMPIARWNRRFAAMCQPGPEALWGAPLPVVAPAPLTPHLARAATRVHELFARGGDASRLLAHLVLGEAVAQLAAWHVEQRRGDRPLEDRIAEAEDAVRRSPDARMNVAAFAAAAGLRPSRFHEVYAALRGTTPAAFLLDQRMRLARHLLADTGFDVATVAAMTGYADATAFGRAFRREHHASPAQWRARRRAEP